MVNFIKEHPIIILGVGLVALTIWIAADLATSAPLTKPTADAPLTGDPFSVTGPPAEKGSARGENATLPVRRATVSTGVLPNLKPGMSRFEVEGYLGEPTPGQVQPMMRNNGRITYSTAYELDDIGPPMTIRPIHSRPRSHPQPQSASRLTIAFVFDASKPGHPLIDILYPDPLF